MVLLVCYLEFDHICYSNFQSTLRKFQLNEMINNFKIQFIQKKKEIIHLKIKIRIDIIFYTII